MHQRFVLSFLAAISITTGALAAEAMRDRQSFNLQNANQHGVFNAGDADAAGGFEQVQDRSVLKIDYSVSGAEAAGVWFKDFPETIDRKTFDIAAFGAQIAAAETDPGISVCAEIKGSTGTQVIRMEPGAEWIFTQKIIDWNTVGDLKEVVFVISKISDGEYTKGSLYIDFNFKQLPWHQKAASSIPLRLGTVVLSALILTAIAAFLIKLVNLRKTEEYSDRQISEPMPFWLQNILFGLSAALIAVIVFQVYAFGSADVLNAGWWFLLTGFMGVLTVGLLKFAATGRHLSLTEVFQSMCITGLLASTSGNIALLQAPSAWTEILLINKLTASATCLIYFLANAYTLASAARLLKTSGSILLAGVPYLFGWLLLLESPRLIEILGNSGTAGLITRNPEILKWIGRFIVVFVFNEAVTNGIACKITRKWLKNPQAHLFIASISLCVVSSPLIADLGSAQYLAVLPAAAVFVIAILTTILAHAGLWAEVYLLTGMIMDGMHNIAPSWSSVRNHTINGVKKGIIYSGTFIGILYALDIIMDFPASQWMLSSHKMTALLIFGALAFPLVKTIIETFDGSHSFFRRARFSYRNGLLYARGAVIGLGAAYGFSNGMVQMPMLPRVLYGLGVGLIASAGISLVRDAVFMIRGKGRIQTWRIYFTDALLGGFIGIAAAFYLDSSQVPVIIEKFRLYTSSGLSPQAYSVYPLLNKWGYINLGNVTGGVKLFFNEALAGVINWSVAAWLFAINRAFLTAVFRKDKAPIKNLLSKQGLTYLIEHTIQVLRWGLWMSPIINTFLRMMGTATWYNQDGAVRTIAAIFQNLTLGSEEFQAWSLRLFVCVLAYDFFRIIIWLDHMGLRVATLVNLSFLGMDKLDEKCARFIGRSSAARYIPEGVKRFTTWAPLLIPFYIPQGQSWHYAWNQSEAINASKGQGMVSAVQSMAATEQLGLIGLLVLVCVAGTFIFRRLIGRFAVQREKACELSNSVYRVSFGNNGQSFSTMIQNRCDLSRRSYDNIDPCGRAMFIVNSAVPAQNPARYWPVMGNFPKQCFKASRIEKNNGSIVITNCSKGINTTVDIRLPDFENAAEIWTVTLENKTNSARSIKVVPYLEWVLDRADMDRGHTQYNRLFPVMEYVSDSNTVLAWKKNPGLMGFLASDAAPEGFLASRMDFIGRAQSIWTPRVLYTLSFLPPVDTEPYPTFDPLGSLLVGIKLGPNKSGQMRFAAGCARNRQQALEIIEKHLCPNSAKTPQKPQAAFKAPPIGHGEIIPGTPPLYSTFADNGNKLLVHTPYTPRPYDHALSNNLGHYVTVTNRGLQTSSSGNSQQNRLTPDWADTVTKEIPSEAFYLYEPDTNQWYSPTYHPLNDTKADYESEFGVDGTAVFRMSRGTISTELTVFVPIDEPTGVYILNVKNNSNSPCRLRLASYFQIVLSDHPATSGPLQIQRDNKLNALFFRNPRNETCPGYAFASISQNADNTATMRGHFLGKDRHPAYPVMVETGQPDRAHSDDNRPVAAFLTTLNLPAYGDQTIAVILGQTNDKKQAVKIINKYKDIDRARDSLDETRKWWSGLMQTVQVQTNLPEFDLLQNWLKYQAVTERIWARRGFYQTSGAFGFRDQLQDTVNLIWADPVLARKQILLHASQQFPEGDVLHWFHWLPDGRTGFANRSWASDNLLWLVWGVVEYVKMTGDHSILDEKTSYLKSDLPVDPLPNGKHGLATFFFRSTQEDTVYNHCIKAVNLVFSQRMGRDGLPLILTGDWNDGLDEIGSEGKGRSVWLGFFLYYILVNLIDIVEQKSGASLKDCLLKKMDALRDALENTWRQDRYLRAIHDDGTEIGVKNSGVWEIDALTAAWAVMSGINPERGEIVFNTAIEELEQENTVLLGTPPLREDTTPYLGRSSHYPEGVRENGMYCHGVQWLIKAARILAEQRQMRGDDAGADQYRQTTYRLWRKITPLSHVTPDEIEIYGGQPNKQPADMLTTYDKGRMIWNGYTGAAGWLFRQAFEGVIGAKLVNNKIILPDDIDAARGNLNVMRLYRNVRKSPVDRPANLNSPEQDLRCG